MRRVLVVLVAVVTLLLLTGAVVDARPMEWTTICNHVVKPGETVYCIARGYGVSPWAIMIHSGMVLAIPNAPATIPAGPTCTPQCGGPPPPACVCTAYHTVLPGSNLYRISLLYGVSMWRIAECNGILNLNLIRAGAVFCIPGDP